jgi:hypothetical protein
MQVDPSVCPECGGRAIGTAEIVPGVALFCEAADGEVEYTGETKMYWDGQTTERADDGRVTVCCANDHEWLATAVEQDDA